MSGIWASAILGTCVLVWLLIVKPHYLLAVIGGLALVLLLAAVRKSVAAMAIASVVLLIALPIVPGLQEARRPQMFAYLVATIPMWMVVIRISLVRQQSQRLSVAVFATFGGLSLLTVGAMHYDQFRLMYGFVVAAVLALAIALGKAATDRELSVIAVALTMIASITTVMAVIETIRHSPIYTFTTFQTPSNYLTSFRATAAFGHPLVLATFSTFVAAVNMARPKWPSRNFFASRFFTVAVPLTGAATTVSRSLIIGIASGVLAIILARADGERRGAKMFAALAGVAALAGGLFALTSIPAVSRRFDQLSTTEQSVRLNGIHTVMSTTVGLGRIIGEGPRSIAAVFASGTDSAVTFGTVDDQFLTSYADFGIVGFVLTAALALIVIGATRKRNLTDWQRTVGIASITVLMAFFWFDLFAWPSVALLFGIGVGASLGRSRPDANAGAAHDARPIGHATARQVGIRSG